MIPAASVRTARLLQVVSPAGQLSDIEFREVGQKTIIAGETSLFAVACDGSQRQSDPTGK